MQWLTEALGRLPKDFVYGYEKFIVGIFLALLVWFSFQVRQQNNFTQKAIQRLNQIRRETVEPTDRVAKFDSWMTGFKGKKFLSLKSHVKAWDHFKKAYEDGLHNQSTSMPDVFLYFNEEQLRPRHGLRDIIPGLFLSFGILGTFIGVAAGLANLVLTEEMDVALLKKSIIDLMNGMKIKFGASGVGIIFSVLWQVIDKLWFNRHISNNFEELRMELDKTFPLPEETEILERMAESQTQQMRDFQDFFSEVVIEKMVRGVGDAVTTAMAPHLEQSTQMMQQFMNLSGDKQVEGMRQMAEHFLESLQSTSGEQMKHLGSLLERMIEWQEKTHDETSHLIQELQQTARGQGEMLDKTTELTTLIGQYIANIEDAASRMSESATDSSLLQERLSETLENMTAEREVFHNHFQEHMQTLEQNLTTVVATTEKQTDIQERQIEVFEKFDNNLSVLTNASRGIAEVAAAFSAQIEATGEFWQKFEDVSESVNVQATRYAEVVTQVKDVLSYVQENRVALDERSYEIQSVMGSQLDEMDLRAEQMKIILERATESLGETNQQLSQSMGQFSHDLNNGLTRAFKTVDEELSNCVKQLGKVVHQISEQTEELPEQIEKFRDSVREFNKVAVASRNQK